MDDSSKPSASKRHAMAPAPWSDLHGELLVSIAATDGVSLRDYASRGAPPWRHCRTRAFSPSPRATIATAPLSFHSRWGAPSTSTRDPPQSSPPNALSMAVPAPDATLRIVLVDPRASKNVQLGSLARGRASICKIRAVALYDHNSRVAYIDTGGGDSTEDKKWTTVDVADGSCYDDMAFHAGDDKVYFLSSCGSVHVLRMPHGGQPAVIEPLANLMREPNPAAAYAAPYDVVSPKMVTKHIFLCHGSLYQVWKNTNANVNLGSGYFRMSTDEIFVLRYDPGRWPCWDVVKDLGGCSVFLGRSSSPAVVRPAVPEVRADCVYWIDWQGVLMVCDIATGTSKPWVPPCGACKGECWYFGHESMANRRACCWLYMGATSSKGLIKDY
ncbi:hypothetical protein VPH35_018805 [Triticum aestivum]